MLVLSVPQWTNKFRKRPQAKKKKMLTEMKERKQSTSMVILDPCNSHVAEPRQKTKLLFFFLLSLSVFFLMSVNSVRKQSSILFGASCGSFCLFAPMAFSYLAVCASFPKCFLPHSCQALADALTYISLVIGFKSGLNAPPPHTHQKWGVPPAACGYPSVYYKGALPRLRRQNKNGLAQCWILKEIAGLGDSKSLHFLATAFKTKAPF